MSESRPTPGKALAEQTYQFVHWLMPLVERLPRAHKFTLGDRMTSRSLNLLEGVVESVYTKDRAAILRRAQLDIEQLQFLFRLCVDLQAISQRPYEYAARTLDGIGREIGGWQKAHYAQTTRPSVRPDRQLLGAARGRAQGDPG